MAVPSAMPFQPGEAEALQTLSAAQRDAGDVDEAEKAVGAAIRFQGMRLYQRDLASGTPADQALAKNGPMMFWQPSTSPTQTTQAAIAQRQQANQKAIADRQRTAIDARSKAAAALAASKETPQQRMARTLQKAMFDAAARDYTTARTGLSRAATNPDNSAAGKKQRADQIAMYRNQLDDAQKRMQKYGNLAPAAAAPAAAAPAAPGAPAAPAAPTGQKIRVRAPNGKTGTVPAEKLEAAKAAGYTVIQ
jgi:hypothetical protein